jgi:N-acetylglucosaminyldiphosphoundecaprenol N-acetyl-beta-D-mannosaminyltransferase
MDIFNIKLEFNPDVFYSTVNDAIKNKKKGYVCVCDTSVLTRANKEPEYNKIINGAMINTCDGSSIIVLAKMLYKGIGTPHNGPEVFEHYTKTKLNQVVLGNTEEMFNTVKEKLISNEDWHGQLVHMQLPFLKVDEFDYEGIAKEINEKGYDIIWVSLGNPKQEIFMSKIIPLLDHGVLFGIGAALNFWVGELAMPSARIGSLRLMWLTRMFQDPKRQIKGNWVVIKALPKIVYQEWKRKKSYNK